MLADRAWFNNPGRSVEGETVNKNKAEAAAAKARALGEEHGQDQAMPYSGGQVFQRTSGYLAYVYRHAGESGLLDAAGIDDITVYGVGDAGEVTRVYCNAYHLAAGTDFEDGDDLWRVPYPDQS
jgi:hypothetical protein